MHFNMMVFDPPGHPYTHFLFDIVRTFQGGFRTLGYDCSITRNSTGPGAMNILVGSHLVGSTKFVDDAINSGVKYVLLQSEVLVDTDERFRKILVPLARGAVAVWDWCEKNVEALARHDIKAEIIKLGYDAAVEELHHAEHRDIDFCFFGSMSEHRLKILQKLESLGYVVKWMFADPAIYRNSMIEHSEIALSLNFGEYTHVPGNRIIHLVSNSCLVVGESGPEMGDLAEVFCWEKPDRVVELCREVRALPALERREMAYVFHDRLKALRPMSECLKPAIASLLENS